MKHIAFLLAAGLARVEGLLAGLAPNEAGVGVGVVVVAVSDFDPDGGVGGIQFAFAWFDGVVSRTEGRQTKE